MKKKRISKRVLYIILSVMIISVFTLTIAYAVLSTTLNITGSAEVSGSSWGITIDKYDYLSNLPYEGEELEILINHNGYKFWYNGLTIGDAELIKEPTISGTTISNMKIAFTKPGDYITMLYEVTNDGTIPARVESIVRNTPSFSSSTNNSSDIELISKEFISAFDLIVEYDDMVFADVNYILCPGETILFGFEARFNSDATAVPSSNITISNLGGTINFVQADKNTCSNS